MSLRARCARFATVTVVALTALTSLLTGSASAYTAPPQPFDITYGATYFRGTTTWSDRSATVDGTLRGLSGTGCRSVEVIAYGPHWEVYDDRSTSLVCNAVVAEHIPLVFNVQGGAAVIEIYFREPDLNTLEWVECIRYACAVAGP